MGSLRLSRGLLLAAILVVALACAGVARVGDGSADQPSVAITQVGGTLELGNSRAGQAIFQASGLAPGRSVTGTVQLSNTGSLAGELGLSQLDVQDQPGANGGRLSDGVQLDVQDITGGSSIPVFAGELGGLATQPLGSIAPGEARTYRFTASLPDTGAPPSPTAGDNAYVGSGLTVRYAWTATAPDEGGDGGGTTGGGGSTGGSGTGTDGGSGTTPSAVPTVKITVVSKNLLRRGVLDVMTTCDIACRVTTYAQLPKAKGSRKPAKTKARTALVGTPGKAARIRLKLSKKAKKALVTALRRKRSVALRVYAGVSAAQGGVPKRYTRKVSVRRPKPKRR
jgi:spore coat-associated protein N